MTGNTTLLKSEGIILPEKLQQKAIALPCKGSHPSKSQISGNTTKVTLLIPCMQLKVINYVNTCIDCKMFVKKKKKTAELLVQQSSNEELGGSSSRSFWANATFQSCNISARFRI